MNRHALIAAIMVASPGGACVEEPPAAAVWSCLVDAPAPSDEAVVIRLLLLDETTEEPVAGARVRLCRRSDLDCENPTLEAVTDEEGRAVLALVDEYLEISAAGFRETLAMGIGSFEVTDGRKVPIDVHFDLYPSEVFASLAAASDVAPDGALSDIEVLVRDCAYESAGGAAVELDTMGPSTKRRYMVNDLPSATAVETDVASGSVVFFNAPPGLRSISAVLASNDTQLGGEDGVIAVIARAGWLTQVAVVPPSLRITSIEGD